LKRNFIPRGLVPLEQLFDQNDVPTKPTIQPKEEKVQEYDLEIKPTKLVKGQGLAKLLIEKNCRAMGVSLEASISDHPVEEVIPNGDIMDSLSEFSESDWY